MGTRECAEQESLRGCEVSCVWCTETVRALGPGQARINASLDVVVGPLAVLGSCLCGPPGPGGKRRWGCPVEHPLYIESRPGYRGKGHTAWGRPQVRRTGAEVLDFNNEQVGGWMGK